MSFIFSNLIIMKTNVWAREAKGRNRNKVDGYYAKAPLISVGRQR